MLKWTVNEHCKCKHRNFCSTCCKYSPNAHQKYEFCCQRPYWGSLGSYSIFNKICCDKHFCSCYFCYIGYLHGNKLFSLEPLFFIWSHISTKKLQWGHLGKSKEYILFKNFLCLWGCSKKDRQWVSQCLVQNGVSHVLAAFKKKTKTKQKQTKPHQLGMRSKSSPFNLNIFSFSVFHGQTS